MEPYHQLGEVAKLSSWAIELLALCQNNNNNSTKHLVLSCGVYELLIGVPKAPCFLLYSQLRKQVNNAHMIVSPLWRGPDNIHGFILDGPSYQKGKTTAQGPSFPVWGCQCQLYSRAISFLGTRFITIAETDCRSRERNHLCPWKPIVWPWGIKAIRLRSPLQFNDVNAIFLLLKPSYLLKIRIKRELNPVRGHFFPLDLEKMIWLADNHRIKNQGNSLYTGSRIKF